LSLLRHIRTSSNRGRATPEGISRPLPARLALPARCLQARQRDGAFGNQRPRRRAPWGRFVADWSGFRGTFMLWNAPANPTNVRQETAKYCGRYYSTLSPFVPSCSQEPEIARFGRSRYCRQRWPNPAALRRHERSGCMRACWKRPAGYGR